MWFTPEACKEAIYQTFNRKTSTIEKDGNESVDDRDMLDAFGHEITEAARRRAAKNGELLADSNVFDGHISSNDDKDNQPKTVFLLIEMFQLEPSTEGTLGIDDENSLATMATRVSNETQEMSQAVASIPFLVNTIKDDNAITVTSEVTTATTFSSPQNSTESNHSSTPKSATVRSPSLGRGNTTRQHRSGSMDTNYLDGVNDDGKLAADNPSQQNNLQLLKEDLDSEEMLD